MRASVVSRSPEWQYTSINERALYHSCTFPTPTRTRPDRTLARAAVSCDRSRKRNPVQYATEDARKRRVSVLRVTVPVSTNVPYTTAVRCPRPHAHVLTARWLEPLSLFRDRSRKHNPVQYATEDARKRRGSANSQSDGTGINERTLYHSCMVPTPTRTRPDRTLARTALA